MSVPNYPPGTIRDLGITTNCPSGGPQRLKNLRCNVMKCRISVFVLRDPLRKKFNVSGISLQRMSTGPLDPRRRASTGYDSEISERPKLDSTVSMPNHHYKMKGAGLKPESVRPSIRIANIPKELEILRENLKFVGQVLGKGNFGKVEKAILLHEGTENVVAVKMIKGEILHLLQG